jgi:hypothetical protein
MIMPPTLGQQWTTSHINSGQDLDVPSQLRDQAMERQSNLWFSVRLYIRLAIYLRFIQHRRVYMALLSVEVLD